MTVAVAKILHTAAALSARFGARRSLLLLLLAFFFCAVVAAHLAVSTSAASQTDLWIPPNTLDSSGLAQAVSGVTEISLTTKHIVYDQSRQTLYASVPANGPTSANSIVPINVHSGAAGTPISIGTNPGKLALSDNGEYLYASLDGSGSVRRYDLSFSVLGPEFNLGFGHTGSINRVEDMRTAPGQPTTLAISTESDFTHSGLAIYDNGIQRTNKISYTPIIDLIEFGATPAVLYGLNGTTTEAGFRTLAVDENGVTVTNSVSNALGGVRDFRIVNGLAYSNSGHVYDPDKRALVGKFSLPGFGYTVAIDAASDRAYFVTDTDNGLLVVSYRLSDYVKLGSLKLQFVYTPTPYNLTVCGPGILAFRTDDPVRSETRKIFLVQTSALTPVPVTPLPVPAVGSDSVIKLNVAANDLIFDPGTQKIYASVPSSSGSFGNSILPIDASSGNPGSPVTVGSEPTKLAISDNHQYLYAGLNGAAAVRRFDLASQSAGLQFSLGFSSMGNGPLYATDLTVQPGNPEVVVVARRNNTLGSDSRDEDVALFNNGQLRPKFTDISHRTPFVEFSNSPALVYGFGFGAPGEYVIKFGVDDSGVTFQSSMPGVTFGAQDIKFDNGLLYSTTGQVFDPEAGRMIAELPTNGLVAPDAAANRVYFLERGPKIATILAFDMQTFVPVGFLQVPVEGVPTSFIRCGNGLAFSTSGNQVFIVPLSSLHPYDIPIPTVIERPDGIKYLLLPANDIVYSAQDQRIYASVPGYAGSIGNSITSINPQTASVQQSVHVGSEPGKLAISEAGDTIYAALRGAASIRRFDVASNSAGLQFGLGRVPNGGLRYAEDLAIAPDNSNLVAASHFELDVLDGNGVAIYENGIKRPMEAQGNSLAFSGAHLYAYTNDSSLFGLRKLAVNSNGLSQVAVAALIEGFGQRIKASGGVIYATDGTVVEPGAMSLIGKFSRDTPGVWMAPDPANHRVYFLTFNFGTSVDVVAYDSETYLEVGRLTIQNIRDNNVNIRSFIRHGADGLAFNTTDDRIYFLKTSMLQPTGATPVPSPVQVSPNVKRLPLPASDLVYSRNDEMIYASVPSRTRTGAPITFGNSIVPINPLTGVTGPPLYAGSEPKKLAISGDGQFVYAGLDGAGAVARFDTATKTIGAAFSLGNGTIFALGNETAVARFVEDMEVAPGTNGTLAISTMHKRGAPHHMDVSIFDNGIQRARKASGEAWWNLNNVIEFSSSPSTVYGFNIEHTSSDFHKLNVESTGVERVATVRNLIEGQDIKFANGFIYDSKGKVINPETLTMVGRFTGLSFYQSFVLPDPAAGRVYFLEEVPGGTTTAVIRAYDQNTYGLIGTMEIPGIVGNLASFIRWGDNGFAFRTTSLNQGQNVYIVQWPLLTPSTPPVPDPTPTPSPAPSPPFDYSFNVYVADADNHPVSGVNILYELNYQGTATTRNATTDAAGNSFSGLLGCQNVVKVTPAKAGYTFSLQSEARANNWCLSGQDFAVFKATSTAAPSPEPTPGQPTVLTADQIAEIKAWTVGGKTSVYVKPQFPNAGYFVANWGQPAKTGNDFTVDASVYKVTTPSIQAVVTTAQIYDLGPLADGTYNFNFKTHGTLAKSLQFTVNSTLPPSANPIDDARTFVKQQYRDFLNREADQAGEDFWTDNITKCNDPARRPPGQTVEQCTLRQREITSGAFFLSPEFQYTGYYVYRMYQGALGRQPKLSEFTPDALFVGNGIIVNGQLSAAKINQNKADFAAQFVNCTDATKYRCAEFKTIYDGLSNLQFVDKLFQTTGVNASAADRAALVNGLNSNPATETRASVVQKVVDGINVVSEGNQQFTTTYGETFYNAEFRRAFVQLEYFGYMRRDPDDAGYAFWLAKLNQFNGDFVAAEMVLAFISSPEYRARFGEP